MSAASFSRAASVTVVLNDGTELSENVDAVLGTITNPMSREQLDAKCRDLMAPVMGTASCNRLIETIFSIEKMNDIRSLRPLLQRRETATRASASR
jgi:2-methylcitrate dehydratase PrpD